MYKCVCVSCLVFLVKKCKFELILSKKRRLIRNAYADDDIDFVSFFIFKAVRFQNSFFCVCFTQSLITFWVCVQWTFVLDDILKSICSILIFHFRLHSEYLIRGSPLFNFFTLWRLQKLSTSAQFYMCAYARGKFDSFDNRNRI